MVRLIEPCSSLYVTSQKIPQRAMWKLSRRHGTIRPSRFSVSLRSPTWSWTSFGPLAHLFCCFYSSSFQYLSCHRSVATYLLQLHRDKHFLELAFKLSIQSLGGEWREVGWCSLGWTGTTGKGCAMRGAWGQPSTGNNCTIWESVHCAH